ncbi:MAG: DegT/DnrJ/EryC1/StrS family aminotransferase [Alsobacter sp.]
METRSVSLPVALTPDLEDRIEDCSLSGRAPPPSHAELIARDDDAAFERGQRRFSEGQRPVIRWIKGDGQDDVVTRAAIGQATRLLGNSVDYCLCTAGLDAGRVREILAWAVCPVEWWPLSPADNPVLADLLDKAECPAEAFGYWWKWFPERVRPDAPEWILDGDMVIVGRPEWLPEWLRGEDTCRVSQDDRWPVEGLYGNYVPHVDLTKRLYSGLVSLQPGQRYMDAIARVLSIQPLAQPHDGRRDMCEQGVVAAAFQDRATPLPLYDFPFGRGFEDHLDYGLNGNQGRAWGYHFGHAFRGPNKHFERLTEVGVVFSRPGEPALRERFAWLGGSGQWGVPAWGASFAFLDLIQAELAAFAGRRVLEIGTSRGGTAAILASLGCRVVTVDRHDRGAATNLAGLDVDVVVADGVDFLTATAERFDAIVVDLHGNSREVWAVLGPLLLDRLSPGGIALVNNARLHHMAEWQEEDGVADWLGTLGGDWSVTVHEDDAPGVAVVRDVRPPQVPFLDLARSYGSLRADFDAAIARVMDSQWFLRGPEVDAFEREWAAFCGQAHAVCCNSGTDALTIAATAMALQRVDVPAATLPLTALGLQRSGADVVLKDVGEDGRLAEAGPDSVPVLFYGRPPNAIEAGARLFDAAHAHGWQVPRGAVAAWSFYPTKTLGALGDGGAVTTDDENLAREMRMLCGRDDRLLDGRQITSRMDEIQAAVLRVKLRHLPRWLEERQAIGAAYQRRLAPLGITLEGPSFHHLYVVRVPDRDAVAERMVARGVGVKVHWSLPLHRVPGAWDRSGIFPMAEAWCASVLSLPCYPGLREDEIARVCEVIEAELAAGAARSDAA